MACQVGCDFNSTFEAHLTRFSCQELIDYCKSYSSYVSFINKINPTINASLLIAGFFGMISYIFMIIVFTLPYFGGASFIYHKSIVYMELIHMFVMAQSGLERFIPKDEYSFSYVYYIKQVRELWMLGDAMKFAVSLVTTFLSVERFIAIWLPRFFSHFNKPAIAWSLVVISVLISLLSFSPAFTTIVVEQFSASMNRTIWVAIARGNESSLVGGDVVVTNVIYGIKILSSAVILFCCVGVAVGLYVQSKKADSLSSNARRKWHENRVLCILQLLIAFLQLIDHAFWIMSGIVADKEPTPSYLGVDAIAQSGYTYQLAMAYVDYKGWSRWAFGCQEVTGELDHATRLVLYLAGMKKFREAAWTLLKRRNLKVAAMDMRSAGTRSNHAANAVRK